MKFNKLLLFLIVSLIILILFTYSSSYTIPLIFGLMVLYIFLLELKINSLIKETQLNVNLIEIFQKDVKILSDNQKFLNKSLKDINNKLIKNFISNKEDKKNNLNKKHNNLYEQ